MAAEQAALGEILRPIRGRLRLAVAAQTLSAIAGVVPFIAIAELGRVLLGDGADRSDRAWTITAVAVGALFVRLALMLAAGALSHFADDELQSHIRRGMVARLARVPLGWFSARNSGTVKKAVQDDVDAMHHMIAHSLLEMTSATVVPVVSVVYLLWVDWLMTLVTLAPLVIGLGLYSITMAQMAKHLPDYDRAMGEINASAVEFVQGVAVVKTFGQTHRAHQKFRDAADDFAAFFLSWVRSTVHSKAVAEMVLSPIAVLLAVVAGGALLVTGDRLAGVDLLPFALLGVGLTAPVLALFYASYELRFAKAAAARVGEVLNAEELPVAKEPRTPAGNHVSYQGVRFSYDGEKEALAGIDLELAPGTVTALVGPSGSGKSTLATLLPRFADVTGGSIGIGGVDVRDLALDDLYRRVAFVFQDVRLTQTSVADNIAMARPGASREEVIAAARAACVHEEIEALPRGYDSVVGEDARFSGGQAQRISIARALLADTPIIVLDEAAAYADPQSEAEVQAALSELTRGKIVLMIAHRLSTVVEADRIVVLEDGAIVEEGTHPELVARGGRYARMWQAHERSTVWQPHRGTPDPAAGTAQVGGISR
ncbi:ABC transporter ATP-binding protein [Streptomyces lichenis]|uniref:ABC transporter ATP-binding protein/permease n=1 Tax=Streptomyces lichenis TaxID=2306967 RepID=A0ABT0IF46_9ACTN|nr:ABC transporter ATP-binding protein [Streptomyces lichenis]MCK8679956.1 ABC transporter ATP-binding protein/permease [Streptomyces lichenis]